MILENLLANLNNPQPQVRLEVARVLGMVDETRALKAVGQRYKVEADPAVREALAWAGQRLYGARQAGYSTIDEIFRYFGVDNELENTESETEAELLKKLQANLDRDLLRMQASAGRKKVGMAAAAGLAGAMMGGMSMGMGMMGSALKPGAEVASSNLGERPQLTRQRTPATIPSQADISLWARRLQEDPDPGTRVTAAVELASLKNPAALPHLATAFVSDPSAKVREAAQRAGKFLYWSTVYWHMEQDGSLAQEMQRRAQAMGKTLQTPASAPAPSAPPGEASAAPPPQDDISAILRAANVGRKRRMKK